jgi:hypothetical protein
VLNIVRKKKKKIPPPKKKEKEEKEKNILWDFVDKKLNLDFT